MDTTTGVSGDVAGACSVASCERPAVTRGWCQSHYLRWYRTGDVQPDRPLAQRRRDETCTAPGCTRPIRVRGLCPTHFRQRRATAA